MKVKDIMSGPVIRIHDKESVAVAARTLTHYNIGALPVCGSDGRLCGVLTDRDIVSPVRNRRSAWGIRKRAEIREGRF